MKRVFLLALAAIGSSAFAFDISGGSGGGAIPDGIDTTGSGAGAPLIITLNVAGTGLTITSLDLAGVLGFTHTWIGDLTVVLSHAGVSVDLMDRDYKTAPANLGTSSDLNGDYMFSNTLNGVEGSPGAFAGGTNTVNPSGTYNRWNGGAFGSTNVTGTFSDFAGKPLDGAWTMTFNDYFAFDTGAAQGMRIVGTASAVPEPATLTVFALGAAAMLRRRRK